MPKNVRDCCFRWIILYSSQVPSTSSCLPDTGPNVSCQTSSSRECCFLASDLLYSFCVLPGPCGRLHLWMWVQRERRVGCEVTSPSHQEGDHRNEEEGHVLKILFLLFFAESQTINIQPKKSWQNGTKHLWKIWLHFFRKAAIIFSKSFLILFLYIRFRVMNAVRYWKRCMIHYIF